MHHRSTALSLCLTVAAVVAGCARTPRATAPPVAGDTACGRAADGIYCARFSGDAFGPVTRWTQDFGDAQGFADDLSTRWTTLRTPDLDGDGRTDICLLGKVAVYCALRVAPAAFGPLQRSVLLDGGGIDDESAAASFALADLDGDGHADLCLRATDGLHCALGAGDGRFAAAASWATWPFADADGAGEPTTARSLRFADVDGDGRADVCLRKSDAIVCAKSTGSAFATPTTWSGELWHGDGARPPHADLALSDLDGDGRADLCVRDGGGVRCFVSTGAAFTPFATLLPPPGAAALRLGDLDGDGRADVCVWQPAGLSCARATPHGLGPLASWEGTAFAPPRFARADARSFTLVDVDGDGRADACGRSRDGLSCALSDGEAFVAAGDSGGAFADGVAPWHDRPDVAALAIGERTAPAPSSSNRTARENELPGASAWWVPYPQWSAQHEVEAYTDATSYAAGATAQVMLSTSHAGDGVDWTLYRTGWYGGFGARAVAAGRVVGNPQPLPPEAAGTHPAVAAWKPSFALPLPRDAVSGVYALRLDSETTGKSFFVTFVVREDRRAAALVVNRADYTDAAYNDWDGGSNRSSAYLGARYVSLDRPLRSIAALGIYAWSSGYFVYEYPMVRWLESQGYDVKYVSDADFDRTGSPLANARAFLSVGHDEYWSRTKRDKVEAARDAGVHLGFFGADAVDGRIRFADRTHRSFSRTISDANVRKDEYADLPLDPSKPAHENPSDELIGTHYAGWCEAVHGDCGAEPTAKLRDADDFRIALPAHPIFRTLGRDVALPHTVGYEYEVPFDQPGRALPWTMQTLARAPAIDLGGVSPVMVAYRAPSNALVVNLGSMHWTLALDDWTGRAALRLQGDGSDACRAGAPDCYLRAPSTAAQQITANILTDFGAVAATPSPELVETAAERWP